MSSPVLYKANETNFNHLGLGVLTDAVSCLVTEERNGLFELEMEYPVDGLQFKQIKNDRLIKVDASRTLKDQRFKIIRISKPMKGLVTVYAEHVSYLAQDLALKPDVSYSGVAIQALSTWQNSFVDAHPFTTYSDVKTEGSGKWSLDKVENARLALGGVSGSLLDTYGGEYMFDNYHVMLFEQRGSDSGALIAYGRNLMELTEEELIDSTYTSIYPYAIYTDDNEVEHLITLPEYFLDSQYAGNFARRKLLKVDFSEDEVTTVEDLRSKAESYLVRNNVGVPKVNQKIKFVDLARTLDYDDMQLLEDISLCDIITIYFEKFDLQTKAKVIKTVWDVLLDQYDSIEVGEARASLSRSIDATIDGKLETVTRRINSVQIAANGKNKVYRGADEPANGVRNDLWYKPVGEGEIEMYIHDGAVWHLEKYSGDTIGGTINFANVNGINFNAANIVTGTLRSIDLESVTIRGSTIESTVSGTEYTRIEGAQIESRGTFERTWQGVTKEEDVFIRTQKGYMRFRNNNENSSLYFSHFGISTYIDGEGEDGGSSGTINWWDGKYSPSNANGLTINSHGGVVALESNLNRIVLNAYASVNVESKEAPVYIRPYTEGRAGRNTFNFTVADVEGAQNTDGFLMYGADDTGYGSGLRFSKTQTGRPFVAVVDQNWNRGGDTVLDSGNVWTNEVRKRDGTGGVYWNGSGSGTTGGSGQNVDNTLYASGIRPKLGDSDLFLATDTGGAVRVTNYAGYNGGNGITYRPIAAQEFVVVSSREYKKNIEPYTGNATSLIDETPVRLYHMNDEDEEIDFKHVGLIVQEAPREIVNMRDGDSLDMYSIVSLLWKSNQELSARIKELESA